MKYIVFAAALALAGCRAASPSSSSGTTGGAPLTPPANGFQITMQATVKAGSEVLECSWYQMPAQPEEVIQWRSHFDPGSHHLVLFRTDLTGTPPAAGTFDCNGSDWMNHVRGVAFAAQLTSTDITLPAGVSQHFQPNEVILVQSHYLNAGDSPITAHVEVNGYYGDPATITQHAGTLFFYDPFIYVPPRANGATATLRCPIPADIHLLTAGSHMHKRGISYLANALHADGTSEQLYTTTSWDAPEPRDFTDNGTNVLHAGSSIQYTCTYANPDATPYIEGPSAEKNEMCMFVGLYYPQLPPSAEFCLDGWAIGSGASTCMQAVSCASGCSGEACLARCISDSCPGAGVPLTNFLRCAEKHCQAACGQGGGGSCQSCIASNCGSEYGACASSSCG